MTRSCYWGFLGMQWVRWGEYSSECRGGAVWIIFDGFGLWAWSLVAWGPALGDLGHEK